jgi:hypothetical protein
MKNLVVVLLLLCAALPSWAANPCPPTHKDLEWSLQCFDTSAAGRRVKAKYLHNVRVKKNGVAIIRIDETFEMLAVDRRGRVVIPDIAFAGDHDYPSAPGNVGRYSIVTRDADGKYISGKCGYFDTLKFKVLIPAVYDECSPFHRSEGHVCTACVRYCTDDDCHDSVQVGGMGMTVNRHNVIVHTAPLDTLDTICNGAPPRKLDRARHLLECAPTRQTP